MEENEIFGSILCKSLQIVADFELHSFLLHGSRLEDPQTHSLQTDPAQQEVIGDLDDQGAMYALYLHEIVQKQLHDPGLTKGEVDVVRNFLIFARSCGQDSQNKQGNSIVGVVCVIAEGQHQLRVVAEISYRAQAELERFLEGLKRVLEAEVRSLGDDPSHAILKHLRGAVPNFREGVDEPSPLVIVADFPLYLIEELGGEEAVDDQVAEMRNGYSHILIDHFHEDLQIVSLVFRRRHCDDLCEKGLVGRALRLRARLLHEGGDLLLAHVRADFVKAIGEFPHWHYNLEGLATEIYLNRAFPKICIDLLQDVSYAAHHSVCSLSVRPRALASSFGDYILVSAVIDVLVCLSV